MTSGSWSLVVVLRRAPTRLGTALAPTSGGLAARRSRTPGHGRSGPTVRRVWAPVPRECRRRTADRCTAHGRRHATNGLRRWPLVDPATAALRACRCVLSRRRDTRRG